MCLPGTPFRLTRHGVPPHHLNMLAIPSFLAPAAVYARLLNALLKREDWARERLYPHAGKTVRFVAGPVRLSLGIESSGYTHASNPAIVPDVVLTIPSEKIAKLPSLLRSQDPSALVSILHIEGDAGLAQTVSDLARDLRWDVEHDLALRVGDAAAMRLMQAGSSLVRAANQSARHLAENVTEYVAHESALLANQPALTVWETQMGALRQTLEQLEHRTAMLEQRSRQRTAGTAPSLAPSGPRSVATAPSPTTPAPDTTTTPNKQGRHHV